MKKQKQRTFQFSLHWTWPPLSVKIRSENLDTSAAAALTTNEMDDSPDYVTELQNVFAEQKEKKRNERKKERIKRLIQSFSLPSHNQNYVSQWLGGTLHMKQVISLNVPRRSQFSLQEGEQWTTSNTVILSVWNN